MQKGGIPVRQGIPVKQGIPVRTGIPRPGIKVSDLNMEKVMDQLARQAPRTPANKRKLLSPKSLRKNKEEAQKKIANKIPSRLRMPQPSFSRAAPPTPRVDPLVEEYERYKRSWF